MQQQCKWWIYLPPAAPPQALNTLPGHLSTLILLETKFWVFLGIRNIFDKIFYGKKVQIMFVNNGSSILIYFEHITYETKKSFSMTWKLERFKIATKKVFFLLSDKKLFTGIFLNLYVGKLISGLTSYGCHFKLQYFAFIWTQTHFKTIVDVQSPSWYQAEHLIMHIDILDIV